MEPRTPRQRLAALVAAHQKGAAAFAVASGQTMGGAIAIIVRDPSAPESRLVIFNEDHLTEEVAITAPQVLVRDEVEVPSISDARRITIFGDRKMRLDVAGTTKWRGLGMGVANLAGTSYSDMIKGLRPSGRPYTVNGVGVVMLVRPGNGNGKS
jgi:hypothetical protein